MKQLIACILLGLLSASILFGAFLFAAVEPGEDFSDSGVGCINDCLEPAEEQ